MIEFSHSVIGSIHDVCMYAAEKIYGNGHMFPIDIAIDPCEPVEGDTEKDVLFNSTGWYGIKEYDGNSFDNSSYKSEINIISDYYGGGCFQGTTIYLDYGVENICQRLMKIVEYIFDWEGFKLSGDILFDFIDCKE